MSTPQQAFAKRLRELRRRHFGPRGKAEFAQRLAIDVAEYERYERGALPPGELMVRACEVTGEDLQWLLTGTASRGTVVISGARNRHADLLTRIAALLDDRPTLAASIDAFVGLLEQGEQVRPTREAAALPVASPEHLIRIFTASDLPAQLPAPSTSDGGRGTFPLAVRGTPEVIGTPALACLHEPSSRYYDERAQKTSLVVIRDEDGAACRCVQDQRLAECFPDAFGVTIADDSMQPMFVADDAVIVAAGCQPKLGRPALCRLADESDARIRIWLGAEGEHISLGRVGDGEIERVAEADLLWSLEALFRLTPAA